jgi:hypothetical protein
MRRLTVVMCLISLIAVVGASAAERSADPMGRSGNINRPAFKGFYDGRKLTFLSTDVSDAAEARMMHVNFAPLLKKVPDKALADLYIVQGRHAIGQLPVFSAEPGEKSYSPLWDEVYLRWKAGVVPLLLTKDDQIEDLIKKGDLIKHEPHVILNCPIVKPTSARITE